MHDNDDASNYDTRNPNSYHMVSFIRENRIRYNQEIHRCFNICICCISTVVLLLVSGITLSLYYTTQKQNMKEE